MRAKYLIIVLVVLVLMAIGYSAMAVTEKSSARSEAEKKLGALSTGLEDQTGVAVTIYNVNLGLVKDQREIKLLKGLGELRFMDVASQIIPTSVHIKSLIDPGSLQILEQNYEYDLLNPQKLLDKYVGKEVKLYYRNIHRKRRDRNSDAPVE